MTGVLGFGNIDHTGEETHVKAEAEIGVRQLQARNAKHCPWMLEEARKVSPPEPSEGAEPRHTLI